MRLSVTFLALATISVAALVVAGVFGLAQGDDNLFFGATFGALLCCACIYLGFFAQGLRPTSPLLRGRIRTMQEELDALAEANPDRPGLRRFYGWFLAILCVAIIARTVMLFT
jgi:hypothetical protein